MARVRAVAGVVIVIFGLAASSAAQGTGDIVGRVADSSGGVLPGVTVTATSLATNISRTTVTSETGDYAFTLLSIGFYEVKTDLAGFKTQTARVTLSTGDRARVDVKLELGAVSESVTVAGESPLLQTDTSRASVLETERKRSRTRQLPACRMSVPSSDGPADKSRI
jgi:hypothetical protein